MSSLPEPDVGFKARYHRPKFYRYQVADPGLRACLNVYRGARSRPWRGTAYIGVGLIVGRWAYCAKWANAETVFPTESREPTP